MANPQARRLIPGSLGTPSAKIYVTPIGIGDTDTPRTPSDVQGIRSGGMQVTALAAAATTLVLTTNFVKLTGDGLGNVLSAITGAVSGVRVRVLFVDGLVTITDDATLAADTVSFAGTGDHVGKPGTVLDLIHDGTSWYARPMQRVIDLPYGGKMNSVGRFASANGISSTANSTSKAQTRQPIPADGILTALAYDVTSGTIATQFKVWISGVVQATFLLSPGVFSPTGRVVFSTPVQVAVGEYAELEYDAGPGTNDSTFLLLGTES